MAARQSMPVFRFLYRQFSQQPCQISMLTYVNMLSMHMAYRY